jgi:hypothetical protein
MKSHKNYRETLLLYLYEELTEAERAEVEAHLSACPECRAELQNLRALHQAIPGKPLIEPDEAALQSLRNMVAYKIRSGERRKGGVRNSLVSFLQPAPALRIGFAVLIFFLGIFLGRQGLAPESAKDDMILQDLLTASRQIQSGNSAVNPLLAGVERIHYDPVTGTIEIYYTTVNDIRLRGKADNATVRLLLRQAMLEEQDPTVRLHAVKTVKSIAESNPVFDKDITEALMLLLEKEQNPGVRLKVLKALSLQMPDPAVKATLVRVLLDDPKPPMRIEALEGILAHQLSQDDLNILKVVVKQDPNNYIRSLAEKALAQQEGAVTELELPNI